jgi:DNA-binding NarL/FixJ family response regulator
MQSKNLMAMIAFQALCALYFAFDVSRDILEGDSSRLHSYPELAVTIGLAFGIWFEASVLRNMLSEKNKMSQSLGVASGELASIMEDQFRSWSLTSAEKDVATFTIKGFSIAEIAKLRGSADGTIKTHLNAIYRKAGVPGRAQLVSIFVEDLLTAPLVEPQPNTYREAEVERSRAA